MRLILSTLCLIFLFLASSHAAVTKIVGANVDASVPRPPDGICRQSFNMTSVGIVIVPDQSTQQQIGLAPAEASYDGFVYFTTRTAASNTNQYQIAMTTLAVQSTLVTNTADNPDFTNTLDASHYNTFIGKWVSIGHEPVAPCNITNCVHFRSYTLNVLATDASTGAQSTGSTGRSSTYDSTHTYIQYSGPGGPVRLGKFTSGNFLFIDSDQVGAGTQMGGIVNDGSFVYGTATPLTIKRWSKANISGGETDFTPGFTTNSIQIPSMSSDGFIYVPGQSAGASPNLIYRVRASDMTITGTGTLGNAQFITQVLIDEINNKLYAIFSTGPDQQITRFDRSTLASEATFVGTSTPNGPTLGQAQIDVPHQAIYMAFNASPGVDSRIQKVSLCS
jgi:hypothetical protein